MASMNQPKAPPIAPQVQTATVAPSVSTASGFTNQSLNPFAQAQLDKLLAQLGSGGTPEQQAALLKQAQTQALIQNLLQTYSPEAARIDASGASNLAMAQAYEKALPQITAAINAAGSSGGGAQTGIAQKMQRDAALAADAATTNLRSTYAGATTNLSQVLANMANNPLGMNISKTLVDALGIAPKSTATGSTTNNPGSSTTTTLEPLTAAMSSLSDPSMAAPESSAGTAVPDGGYLAAYFRGKPEKDIFGNTVYRGGV